MLAISLFAWIVDGTRQKRISLLNYRDRTSACIFCGISEGKDFEILWESEKYVAFKDHKPASTYHFLVVPKEHIGNVKSLRRSDAAMLREMHDVGKQLIHGRGISPTVWRMGFHIAPFHSVEHLHLHVHGLPYRSPWRAMKYPIIPGYGTYTKGLSWFVEIEQAISILERGNAVQILPC